MSEKRWRTVKALLLVLSVLAAVKMIFFDYTMDEEYQLMMAYRNLNGDRLFGEMWEPHQTSAFLCIALMGCYHLVTGTYTGVLLFLRAATTLIQILLSVFLYRSLKGLCREREAFLLSLLYFNSVPKAIQIPEFANMQLWFFTLMILFLMRYEQKRGSKEGIVFLILSGGAMALEVLSYPSCLILFPYVLLVLYRGEREKKWKAVLGFAMVCGMSGLLWLLWILRRVTLSEFLRNVKLLLNFDLTHELSGVTADKVQWFLPDVLRYLGLLALVFGIALAGSLLWQKREKGSRGQFFLHFAVLAVLSAEVLQLFYWVVCHSGYEYPQIVLLVLWILAIPAWHYAGAEKKALKTGIWGAFLSILAVIYISDLPFYMALPHGLLGTVFVVLLLVSAIRDQEDQRSRGLICLLLVSVCLLQIFGKGYTLRAGRNYPSVLATRGIMKEGPAIGVLSDYMNAYIYNCNAEDFRTYLQPGDRVLIVTNKVFSAGTTPYLFQDVDICHYSIVDPTAYDERLLTYWELYPQKYPNVIVVDCWYGQLQEDPQNWIMQYIENDFGYERADDGRYVRFYRK